MKSIRYPLGVNVSLEISIKSTDVRNTVGLAPATFSEFCRKESIDQFPKKGNGSKKIFPADVRKLLTKRGYVYPSEIKALALIMCKGGVGKSTSTFLIGRRMASYGAKVLLIDADPQGNLTSSFSEGDLGFEIDEETPVLSDIIAKDVTVQDSIVEISETLHLIPSTPMNAVLESTIREKTKNPAVPIRQLIKKVSKKYDYILFDCAPALNLTNTSIMLACNELILPMNPDPYSMIGLEQTFNEIQMTKDDFPDWRIKTRILFTKFDAREHSSLKYLSSVAEKYKNNLFTTTIRTSTDPKNAIDKREDLFLNRKSVAREDYDALTREIMGLDKLKKSKKSH